MGISLNPGPSRFFSRPLLSQVIKTRSPNQVPRGEGEGQQGGVLGGGERIFRMNAHRIVDALDDEYRVIS